MDLVTSEATLIENVCSTWCSISAKVLDNLMCEMPERMRACVEKCGDFSNHETMDETMDLLIFLLLHEDEGAINFGTPCRADTLIEETDKDKYLGIVIDSDLNIKKEASVAVACIKSSLNPGYIETLSTCHILNKQLCSLRMPSLYYR